MQDGFPNIKYKCEVHIVINEDLWLNLHQLSAGIDHNW
jgi:hypothetical protein